jgi:hypothetical protein
MYCNRKIGDGIELNASYISLFGDNYLVIVWLKYLQNKKHLC